TQALPSVRKTIPDLLGIFAQNLAALLRKHLAYKYAQTEWENDSFQELQKDGHLPHAIILLAIARAFPASAPGDVAKLLPRCLRDEVSDKTAASAAAAGQES